MEGRSQRQRGAVNYSEGRGNTAGSGTPLWLKRTSSLAEKSAGENAAPAKENTQPAPSGKARKEAGVAQRGRNAGVSVVPIADHKKQQQAAPKGKQAQSSEGAKEVPVGAATTRQVPGLPGVVQKPEAAKPAVNRGKAAADQDRAGPSNVQQSGSGGQPGSGTGKRKQAPAPVKQQVAAPDKQPQAVAARKRASAPAADAAPQQQQQPAVKRHKSAGAAMPPAGAAAAAPKPAAPRPPGPAAPAPATAGAAAVAAPPAAAAAAAPSAAMSDPEPAPLSSGDPAAQLVEHYSSNFRALQEEYDRLQQQYEDLKRTKIDQEVLQLLEQHNKYVTDHGAKAAEVADHWRQEKERLEAVMREQGNEAAVAHKQQLEVDLLRAQQGLLEMEAAGLEKDKLVAELERRNAFLERHARIPTLADKCVQTDAAALASAGNQAPSVQTSGVEMLEARAMLPEGAAGGSIYKRPQQLLHCEVGAGAGSVMVDASYTLPPPTQLPAHRPAAMAAPGEVAPPPAPLPVTGSDMQLTGSRQAVEGRLAHAAAPVPRPGSGLTAESVLPAAAARQAPGGPMPLAASHPAAVEALSPAAEAAAAAAGLTLRRVSLAHAAVVAAPLEAAGAQRVEKQLHFPSASLTSRPRLSLQPQPQQSASILTAAQGRQPAAGAPAAVHYPAAAVPAASARPASSGPLAPRELALTALTGLQATPLKRGFYKYSEPNSGFTFELGPATRETVDWCGVDEDGPSLYFRPLDLGRAAAVLPSYLQYPIVFSQAQQQRFVERLMDALRRVQRQKQQE